MEVENKVAIAVLALYLYRQAGCPYGESLSGLNMWVNLQMQVFEEWADKIPADEP